MCEWVRFDSESDRLDFAISFELHIEESIARIAEHGRKD
jgi:hypothetical protein